MEESSGQRFTRSEGLGVASIAMFEEGFFSGSKENPHQVDGQYTSLSLVYHDAAGKLREICHS